MHRVPTKPVLAFSMNQRTKQRDGGEENDEDDGDVEHQSLHASPGLKDGARSAAKCAAESRPSYLEQDEDNHRDTENDLDDTNCRKPLRHNLPP